MHYFKTYFAASKFAERNNVPEIVIYTDFILEEDEMVFIVPLP